MDIEIQFLIRSNPNLYRFLREESYWYKYLMRNPRMIKEVEKKMKEKYKLTKEDKLERINQRIGLLNGFMEIMK